MNVEMGRGHASFPRSGTFSTCCPNGPMAGNPIQIPLITEVMMEGRKVVSHEEWLAARRELLAEEKELTRLRDRLSQKRRDLPWARVEKEYVFDTESGKQTLPQLFDGRGQLLVYHFMFDPSWEAGCKSCSFWADNFNGIVVHLKHRDVTMMTISRAPLDKLMAYRRRMGWTIRWASSLGNDFN